MSFSAKTPRDEFIGHFIIANWMKLGVQCEREALLAWAYYCKLINSYAEKDKED